MDTDYVVYELVKRIVDKYCYFKVPEDYQKFITDLAHALEI